MSVAAHNVAEAASEWVLGSTGADGWRPGSGRPAKSGMRLRGLGLARSRGADRSNNDQDAVPGIGTAAEAGGAALPAERQLAIHDSCSFPVTLPGEGGLDKGRAGPNHW